MAESIRRLERWPGADDRLDPMFAMGTSVALHLLALLLLLTGGLGSGTSARSDLQGASDAPTSALDASEFRQRLVLVPLPRPSKKTPTTTAAKAELLPGETPPPTPVSERPLDARIEISTQQERTADSSKERPTPDVSQSMKEADSPSESQAQETGADSASGGSSSDQLRAAYLAALRNAIHGKWSVTPGHHGNCSVTVRQAIGGNVTSAVATDCKLDESDRMALEAAALMAQPLPYTGFESVFSEETTLEMSN